MDWLFSKRIDILGMFLPFTLMWVIFLCLPSEFLEIDFPLWAWVVFVLGIDVSHVWSTFFRTYFDRQEFENHRVILMISPIVLFMLAFSLAFISIEVFWRVLAYLAVFHFIKQQYGFLALYRLRKGKKVSTKLRLSDKFIIYLGTGIPIVIWHFSPDPNFNWFVQNDFVFFNNSVLVYTIIKYVLSSLYFILLIIWFVVNLKNGISLGAILWVSFTVLNWFWGIVFLESDIVFTITNVVGHGIPYLLLIGFYKSEKSRIKRKTFSFYKWISIIFSIVLIFALIEEYFWDRLLNHEKGDFFDSFTPYFEFFSENHSVEALLLAILVLPQLWHYFIDGIIWKANEKNPYLKEIFQSKNNVK